MFYVQVFVIHLLDLWGREIWHFCCCFHTFASLRKVKFNHYSPHCIMKAWVFVVMISRKVIYLSAVALTVSLNWRVLNVFAFVNNTFIICYLLQVRQYFIIDKKSVTVVN